MSFLIVQCILLWFFIDNSHSLGYYDDQFIDVLHKNGLQLKQDVNEVYYNENSKTQFDKPRYYIPKYPTDDIAEKSIRGFRTIIRQKRGIWETITKGIKSVVSKLRNIPSKIEDVVKEEKVVNRKNVKKIRKYDKSLNKVENEKAVTLATQDKMKSQTTKVMQKTTITPIEQRVLKDDIVTQENIETQTTKVMQKTTITPKEQRVLKDEIVTQENIETQTTKVMQKTTITPIEQRVLKDDIVTQENIIPQTTKIIQETVTLQEKQDIQEVITMRAKNATRVNNMKNNKKCINKNKESKINTKENKAIDEKAVTQRMQEKITPTISKVIQKKITPRNIHLTITTQKVQNLSDKIRETLITKNNTKQKYIDDLIQTIEKPFEGDDFPGDTWAKHINLDQMLRECLKISMLTQATNKKMNFTYDVNTLVRIITLLKEKLKNKKIKTDLPETLIRQFETAKSIISKLLLTAQNLPLNSFPEYKLFKQMSRKQKFCGTPYKKDLTEDMPMPEGSMTLSQRFAYKKRLKKLKRQQNTGDFFKTNNINWSKFKKRN